MVFKSKLKEELLQEMKNFVFWYYAKLATIPQEHSEKFIRLTKRTNLKYKHTACHYLVLNLVDNADYPLFELNFQFTELDNVDAITIGYYAQGEADLETFTLDDSKSIEQYLVQAIQHIPSETYIKHYLNLFQNNLCLWLNKI